MYVFAAMRGSQRREFNGVTLFVITVTPMQRFRVIYAVRNLQ